MAGGNKSGSLKAKKRKAQAEVQERLAAIAKKKARYPRPAA
jgi:hypothetical protein